MLESIYESDKLHLVVMKINKNKINIPSSEITSESAYINRRKLIQSVGLFSLGLGLTESALGQSQEIQLLKAMRNEKFSTTEAPNSYSDITTYNNFYEFGMQKSDPYMNSGMFEPKPWSVEVSGQANLTGTFDLEDLIDFNKLEERIYRLRCVEAWSMVVPWVGIPLSSIIKRFEPLSSAKYVSFETVFRPEEMPGQKRRNHERLVVGMGCFWGAERMFWQQEGVYSTSVGYSAGKTTDPTYNEVCSGVTDHAEVVLIVYDTETINLNSLLAIFWEGHNPTQFMRQGNDIGTQYRSIIFYDEDETRLRIESSRDQYQNELEKAGYGKIVTEIQSSEKFFYAEDYHQQYLAKNPSGYCGLGGTGIKCSVAD